MAQTMISIRMDEDLKKRFDYVCSELGISMSTAFTIFAKKMSREQRIPFDVSIDPFYDSENMAHLRRGVQALNNGQGKAHELIEEEE